MKYKIPIFMLFALLVSTQVCAQPNICPGWHNPTTFTTTTPQYKYYGKALTSTPHHGSEVGTGPSHYTNEPEIAAGGLATVVACSKSGDWGNRFVIKGSGTDPNTNNNLSFLPPYPDHNGAPYTHSIRVGTECTQGAEVLYYQMRVVPQSSLLTLWYAPVVQTPTSHNQYENSALIIRVSVLNTTTNQWELADNRFEYIVSGQPQTASYPQGLQDGVNGWHRINASTPVWYKDWTKAMISLDQYLQRDVRIEVYMSSCVYDAHYAYCYIAGDFQPMEVRSSGCPAGRSTVVDTLRAPTDMMSYSWYKSAEGVDVSGVTLSISFVDSTANGQTIHTTMPDDNGGMRTVSWTRVSAPSTNGEYLVQADDFIVPSQENPGRMDTAGVQSFMCKMVSYIDPTKPFESFVYQPVLNNKPILKIDTVPTCDGNVHLISRSLSLNTTLDTSKVRWQIYDNANCVGTPLANLTGVEADFQSSSAGTYHAKLWTCTTSDSLCNTEGSFPIRSLQNPIAKIGVIPSDEPCVGDTIQLSDSTFLGSDASMQYNGWQRTWIVDGDTVSGDVTNPNPTYRMGVDVTDTVMLIVRNGLFNIDINDASHRIYCADTTTRVIKVFTSPNLTVTGDTIVCVGSQTNAHIEADVDGCTYKWYYHYNQPGENNFATGDLLQVEPTADTTTYYVKVISEKGCVAWDSVKAYLVRPKLQMIPADGRICPGQTAMLVGSEAHHYSWEATPYDPSLAPQANLDTVVVSPNVTTTYTMTGHGSNDCPATPLQKTVTVIPYPIPTLSINPGFVDSEVPTVEFSDNSPYRYTTLWDFGDGTSMGGQRVSHTYTNLPPDSVYVTMTSANELGCASDTTFSIPVQLFSVWIPTAFTPDLATNNKFSVVTANVLEYFSIFVYDRRGAQVFASTDQNFEWDGTCNGVKCQQGSYAYICRYRRPGTTDIVVRKGTITIVR